MSLQFYRSRTVCLIIWRANILGYAFEFKIILNQNAIEEYSDPCRGLQGAVVFKTGSGPDHFISLPFTGFTAGIGERNTLFVNAAGLAVHIGGVGVVIQHLQFIAHIAAII